ncbi:polymer-forming cytoskeletal protein [Pseudoalteromonas sp. MMG005]|uniref:polymer-forming cytoskeletal protein n=1 Tax=Pseudoalteromonas sp. MMG005 TaxID=2822682 RepID=UPI0032B50BE5
MSFINHKQHGFTLIKVMLLSTMASVVVFGALQEAIVQERLTGNFQKDLNARLLAEKGVFDSATAIKEAIKKDSSLTMEDLLTQFGTQTGVGGLKGGDAQYNALITNPEDSIVEISSHGFRYHEDANSYLVAQFDYIPAENESPFANAVTGCKGVNLSGSGSVDSYDSSQGTYEQTKTNNGDVNTVIGDSDVVINGHSPIKGDVKASGIVYLKGSSPVIGNVQSNTGVDISSGGGLRVEGNVLSRGFVTHRGGSISGYVRAHGDVTMNWGSDILNSITPTELDIRYGGTGTFQTGSAFEQNGVHYSDEIYQFDPTQETVVEPVKVYDPTSPDYDPDNPDKECDPLALPLNMPNVMGDTSTYLDFSVGPQEEYTFTPQRGYFTKSATDKGFWSSKVHDIYIFDVTRQSHGYSDVDNEYVFGMKNFSLGSNGKIVVDAGNNGGDVIWLVDGDFTLSGNTSITITKDTTLTVFVTGKAKFGASAKVITEQEGVAKTGHMVFSMYSSFVGADGIIVNGAADMYASIYAPLTSIKLSGSGQLYGSVRGAVINSSGGSGVHFDEALKHVKIGAGQTGGEGKLEFKGWFYRHPAALPNQ